MVSGAGAHYFWAMASADKPRTPDLADLPPDQHPQAPPARRRGIDVIQDELTRLPGKPGVYRMIGADGEVLYVGKAKSLKNRVAHYAQGRSHGNHIARMVSLTQGMEFIVTATETEALLLETNLIKRLRPRFNVLMRDDKSFPYIAIRRDHAAPALQKHRGAKSFKGEYFGPFASASAVNRTLNTLQKSFLLRSCTDSTYAARTRPCMLYQIKRCAAPCTGEIGADDYARLVADSLEFLQGRSDALQDRLAREMHDAAEALEFEKAARLRNRIRALAAVRAVQGVNVSTFSEADVFALHCEGGQSCIQVFFFRAGQNWGNRAYFPKHERDLEPEEILDAFLAQFYDDKEPPALVLVSHEPPGRALLEEAFGLKADRRVEIRRPERGEKREIMDQAVLNAREALGRRMAESASVVRLLDGVADAFSMARPPERIEVYDNSHIQGANAVGAMIVAGPEGFRKNQYRKFNMKEIAPGDDFAMMQAMIRRRFARLVTESVADGREAPGRGASARQTDADDAGPPADQGQRLRPAGRKEGGVDFSKVEDERAEWPDLLLIDGGEGQLSAALAALNDLGLAGEVTVVGVAKGVDRDAGRERFFMPGKPPFRLDEKSPVLYYLQRLRDEAHRFAIGAHRQKRRADIAKNPLDDIDGVGPARKKALLARFGSARGVARAALAELEGVDGINTELARRIHDYFHTP
ncbi:MAG: excinuclease ABC subunit UvrC [Hyphomonadaceae bacterium]|nr:excinuclease ABC subunit UvrC [Hyphomonadaceae bacterium]